MKLGYDTRTMERKSAKTKCERRKIDKLKFNGKVINISNFRKEEELAYVKSPKQVQATCNFVTRFAVPRAAFKSKHLWIGFLSIFRMALL